MNPEQISSDENNVCRTCGTAVLLPWCACRTCIMDSTRELMREFGIPLRRAMNHVESLNSTSSTIICIERGKLYGWEIFSRNGFVASGAAETCEAACEESGEAYRNLVGTSQFKDGLTVEEETRIMGFDSSVVKGT